VVRRQGDPMASARVIRAIWSRLADEIDRRGAPEDE
jgi:hypothetical protein